MWDLFHFMWTWDLCVLVFTIHWNNLVVGSEQLILAMQRSACWVWFVSTCWVWSSAVTMAWRAAKWLVTLIATSSCVRIWATGGMCDIQSQSESLQLRQQWKEGRATSGNEHGGRTWKWQKVPEYLLNHLYLSQFASQWQIEFLERRAERSPSCLCDTCFVFSPCFLLTHAGKVSNLLATSSWR